MKQVMSDTQMDILVDRIAANEADAADFRAFEAQARQRPEEWEHLARTLRDELHMRAALHAEDHAARAEEEIGRATSPVRHAGGARFSIRTWSGWAAAAVIALAWIALEPLPQQPTHAPDTAAPDMRLVSLTADDAYERYLELGQSEGRIITELPARMIELESAEDGEMVVYYIRQLLERERVNEVYRYAEDELGRPLPVPIDFTSFSMTDSTL
jgi:hypothetical protein